MRTREANRARCQNGDEAPSPYRGKATTHKATMEIEKTIERKLKPQKGKETEKKKQE